MAVMFISFSVQAEQRDVVPLYGTVLDVPAPAEVAPVAPATAEDPVAPAAVVPTAYTPRPAQLPRRGVSMAAVEQQFGAPKHRDPAVGNPPITRWDYDGFSVFFEHQLVLHSVVPERPPEIRNREQLIPAR